MTAHIFKCLSCNSYTLKQACPTCGKATERPLPAKFSPEDKYGNYRRDLKKDELKAKHLY